MARAIWPAAALLSLALAACSGEKAEKSADDEDATKDEAPAIPVEVAQPSRGDIYATYTGTAPIEAYQDAQVIAKVGGELTEIFVEEGEDVNEGKVLARLDGDRLRLELARIEADLQKLRRDYQRNVDLRDKSLISEGDFEKIQFELEALEAAYKLAALELSYTEIKAPIDGVISERFVKVGNTLEANTPLFQVTSLEPLVSYLHVPEREYRRLEPGQTADIEIDALPGEVFTGDIARVSPVVDPDTGTFKITIEVSDPSRRLKPGMFGRIRIVHDKHENALQIPRNAIIEDSGSSTVFVVEDGTASRRSIRTGYSENGMVEILDGLVDGETFVIVGQTGLKDGSRVSVIDSDTSQPANAQAAAVE
ncbi:MAG: efflux RND transporter periplasmic adaptor subunit [Gammaproteobacteria bacterium]|nr:efflux RND transporter periplasmic adaptor subunit [Gammaproteobacteria bacterium]MDH4256090.1 efflux RND transporter periplasmic adaptor subunit [Gammaproteobacteria bacterium]MDH5310011.1 efflux RND transporter periplasmic adaptor subunit [Gammaproteobacteria bacterium]